MIKILLLSDTHSHIDDAILKYVRSVDEVWHAGDIGAIKVAEAIEAIKPLRAVYGNIDDHVVRATYPEIQNFTVEGVKVWMTHIGGYPGRYTPGIKQQLDIEKPKLFISGHSHILKVMPDKKRKILHMNPGAVGKSGFHKARTMLRFEIEKETIKNLEVIEWKR